jgi:hypothetical protein
MDGGWYQWNKEYLVEFKGLKVTVATKADVDDSVYQLKRGIRPGLDQRPEFISQGSCSGEGAAALAQKLGARRIVLAAGFEMHFVNGVSHYHNEHKRKKPVEEARYTNVFLPGFVKLKGYLEELGVEILNATPNSRLTMFKQVKLEEVL